ncbi:unnamed protein product [Dibothriocephalus latus]|uniref:Uncharacterized protein n=1 Tax=Dibothriocephalus latus TaxID=60516 RepID=A0A3P6Q5J0_DIBLA|nr:unnamed protein product [Dibothriocephalus latus]
MARVLQQKEKLESLCRELQKQNHQIKEESMQMAESEDKQRKAVADRFQASIVDIQKQLGEYLNKNKELREENQQLAERLQNFIKDHESREGHVQKVGNSLAVNFVVPLKNSKDKLMSKWLFSINFLQA